MWYNQLLNSFVIKIEEKDQSAAAKFCQEFFPIMRCNSISNFQKSGFPADLIFNVFYRLFLKYGDAAQKSVSFNEFKVFLFMTFVVYCKLLEDKSTYLDHFYSFILYCQNKEKTHLNLEVESVKQFRLAEIAYLRETDYHLPIIKKQDDLHCLLSIKDQNYLDSLCQFLMTIAPGSEIASFINLIKPKAAERFPFAFDNVQKFLSPEIVSKLKSYFPIKENDSLNKKVMFLTLIGIPFLNYDSESQSLCYRFNHLIACVIGTPSPDYIIFNNLLVLERYCRAIGQPSEVDRILRDLRVHIYHTLISQPRDSIKSQLQLKRLINQTHYAFSQVSKQNTAWLYYLTELSYKLIPAYKSKKLHVLADQINYQSLNQWFNLTNLLRTAYCVDSLESYNGDNNLLLIKEYISKLKQDCYLPIFRQNQWDLKLQLSRIPFPKYFSYYQAVSIIKLCLEKLNCYSLENINTLLDEINFRLFNHINRTSKKISINWEPIFQQLTTEMSNKLNLITISNQNLNEINLFLKKHNHTHLAKKLLIALESLNQLNIKLLNHLFQTFFKTNKRDFNIESMRKTDAFIDKMIKVENYLEKIKSSLQQTIYNEMNELIEDIENIDTLHLTLKKAELFEHDLVEINRKCNNLNNDILIIIRCLTQEALRIKDKKATDYRIPLLNNFIQEVNKFYCDLQQIKSQLEQPDYKNIFDIEANIKNQKKSLINFLKNKLSDEKLMEISREKQNWFINLIRQFIKLFTSKDFMFFATKTEKNIIDMKQGISLNMTI